MHLIFYKIANTKYFLQQGFLSSLLFFSMLINNIVLDKYVVYVCKSIRNGLEIKYTSFMAQVVFGKGEKIMQWQGVAVGDQLNL